MTLPRTVADVLSRHVAFEVESIDRMYLNLYPPRLQHTGGAAGFFVGHRGFTYASSALMSQMTTAFVADIEHFVAAHELPLISFAKGQRKDDVMQKYLAGHDGSERVLFVGKAQEKISVISSTRRRNPHTGATYAWLVRKTVLVSHYYVYCFDDDFGPLFIKFCSYFPFTAKLCINGNEWAKRQAAKVGIGFTALDNGFAAVDDPAAVQGICDQLGPEQIEALARKWLRRLPHPFTEDDLAAGYRYEVSILQAEFSLTQMLERSASPANRRLLDVQRISHDPITGADAFTAINNPVNVDGQHAAALRFGDRRAHALLSTLLVFRLHPRGFTNRDLRTHLAGLLGADPDTWPAGRATYDLRRLRLHGLIHRIPGTHRYQVSETAIRHALFLTRLHDRVIRTGAAHLADPDPPARPPPRAAAHAYETALDQLLQRQDYQPGTQQPHQISPPGHQT